MEESAVLNPDECQPADLAAAYANTSWLLEPFRETTRPDWAPLRPEEFPCRGQRVLGGLVALAAPGQADPG